MSFKIRRKKAAAATVRSAATGQFRVLKNEPRVVTGRTVQRLKDTGASRDLIHAAERAEKTNPPEPASAS
jgi:hypothetical protein